MKKVSGTFFTFFLLIILRKSTNSQSSYEVELHKIKHLSDEERTNLLKTLLASDTPVMIRIGNRYILQNKYNPILGKIITHWITLWSYDDTQQFFYVYDSGLRKKHWDKNIPTGNTTRTYREILRDWSFGRYQPWSWYISPQSYLYIRIKSVQ